MAKKTNYKCTAWKTAVKVENNSYVKIYVIEANFQGNLIRSLVKLRFRLRTADVFPVVASLPSKINVCEPERQDDFRDVKPFQPITV